MPAVAIVGIWAGSAIAGAISATMIGALGATLGAVATFAVGAVASGIVTGALSAVMGGNFADGFKMGALGYATGQVVNAAFGAISDAFGSTSSGVAEASGGAIDSYAVAPEGASVGSIDTSGMGGSVTSSGVDSSVTADVGTGEVLTGSEGGLSAGIDGLGAEGAATSLNELGGAYPMTSTGDATGAFDINASFGTQDGFGISDPFYSQSDLMGGYSSSVSPATSTPATVDLGGIYASSPTVSPAAAGGTLENVGTTSTAGGMDYSVAPQGATLGTNNNYMRPVSAPTSGSTLGDMFKSLKGDGSGWTTKDTIGAVGQLYNGYQSKKAAGEAEAAYRAQAKDFQGKMENPQIGFNQWMEGAGGKMMSQQAARGAAMGRTGQGPAIQTAAMNNWYQYGQPQYMNNLQSMYGLQGKAIDARYAGKTAYNRSLGNIYGSYAYPAQRA